MREAAPDRLPETAWLAEVPLAGILDAMNGEGMETRIVGGAVRDTLLGLPVGDIDLATTGSPDEVTRRAGEVGIRAVPTGVDHGTVTLVAAKRSFEITTLRRDVETHGRHATVAFGGDWSSDARRRDFTMNALYADREGGLHDPLGGYGDLVAGRVRFIGNAGERIAEDYLRILRFFRFHAAYGRGGIDAQGLSAAIRERQGLRRLSAERVRAETLRLLAAPRAADAVEAMAEAGLLGIVLGGVAYLPALRRYLAREGREPLMALAVLGARIPEDAERLGARLRLSRRETARLSGAVQHWWRMTGELTVPQMRRLAYRLGRETALARLRLAWAVSGDGGEDGSWRRLLADIETWEPPVFPLAGGDLIAAGVPRGPGVGALLRRLEEAWVEGDFAMERAELLARVRALPADRI